MYRTTAVTVLALTVAGCATNPATGKTQLSLISESQEIAMGRQADSEVVASIGLYDDPNVQAYVSRLGHELAARSERPNLPWTFRVVDDDAVNAFALPGGFVYVTRGILPYLDSEAELAAVMGHEIGHVTARHSVSQASKQELAQFGMALGVMLKPDLQKYAGLAGAGLNLLFLKYSRDDETQADELGLRYMRRDGYDVKQMPGVFTMLQGVSAQAGGGRVPQWLATHPEPLNRRAHIRRMIAANPPGPGDTVVHRAAFLRQVNGVVFGADPREGYFVGQTFYHPGLALRIDFPAGWHTVNQKQQVAAVSPQQDAVVQLSLATQPTAVAGAQEFYAQQGVSGGPPEPLDLHGLAGMGGQFEVATQNGVLAGAVIFLASGSQALRLLGYAAQANWPTYRRAIEGTLRSAAPVTDRAHLAVVPLRIDVVRLNRAMTLAQFMRAYPSPVSAATIALLNRAKETTRFARGAEVKRVTGRLPPGVTAR